MVREIKFRARFIEDLEWCYFSLEDIARLGDAFPNYSNWSQLTGILDKNGVDIYEGDILRIEIVETIPPYGTKRDEFISQVEYQIGLSGYQPFIEGFQPFEYQYLKGDGTFVEVIGNIHQNPELMEVQ